MRIYGLMEEMRDVLILSNNNLLEYYQLEMSLRTVLNIIDSITFRGSVIFITPTEDCIIIPL